MPAVHPLYYTIYIHVKIKGLTDIGYVLHVMTCYDNIETKNTWES